MREMIRTKSVKKWFTIRLLVAIILVIALIAIPEIFLVMKGIIVKRNEILFAGIFDGLATLGLGIFVSSLSYSLFQQFENVRKSESYKSAIMRSAFDAIVIINSGGAILECNSAAEKIFQINRDKIVRKKISDFLKAGSGIDPIVTFINECAVRTSPMLNQGTVSDSNCEKGVHFEMSAMRLDKSEFPVEVALTQVQLADSVVFTFFIRDISERKSVEIAKDQAIRTRDELIAVVSHELKNPLTAISMNLMLVKRTAPAIFEQYPVLRSSCQNIDASVRRMSRLVSDLLDASRIEAGCLKLEQARFKATDVLKDVFEEFAPIAEEKRIRIEMNIPKGLPEVFCDKERIIQVLSNLLSNAIKFSKIDSTIYVKAENIGDQICFQVKDSGAGISAENLPNIFNRYWQAKPFAFRGTGLGLSIARGIVEAHHGKIWAESSLGAGSVFYFTLPLKRNDIKRDAVVA